MLIKFSQCSASGVIGTGVGVGGYSEQGSLYSNFPTYRMGAQFVVVVIRMYMVYNNHTWKGQTYNTNNICALVDTRVSKGTPKLNNGPGFFIIKTQRGNVYSVIVSRVSAKKTICLSVKDQTREDL